MIESIKEGRWFALAAIVSLIGCSVPGDEASVGTTSEYLFVWTTDADSVDLNFMVVLDANPESERYGSVVTTLAVPTKGATRGHHTEHVMPPPSVPLFANDFSTGEIYLIDLSDPEAPKLVGTFKGAGPLTSAHSFERLENLDVLATFQTEGEGNNAAGGVARISRSGAVLAWGSAREGGRDVRPYSLASVPNLDRVVTGSADMRGGIERQVIQVWRLSDLSLLHTLELPQEWGLAAEPRLLADGETVLVSTFGCALLRVKNLMSEAPSVEKVWDFGGSSCALPIVSGEYWVQAVPAANGLVALDVRDLENPFEVAHVLLEEDDWPHWISLSPDGRRIVVTGYAGTRHRVLIVDFDPVTGDLEVDASFTSSVGADRPGVSFDRAAWPHGESGPGDPHGAVFSRPTGS